MYPTCLYTAYHTLALRMYTQDFLEDDPDLANAADDSEFGTGYRPLHYAAYGGFLEVCEALHAAGARALAAGDNGVTALFLAAQAGKADVVRFLLDLVRIDWGLDCGLRLVSIPIQSNPNVSSVNIFSFLYCFCCLKRHRTKKLSLGTPVGLKSAPLPSLRHTDVPVASPPPPHTHTPTVPFYHDRPPFAQRAYIYRTSLLLLPRR